MNSLFAQLFTSLQTHIATAVPEIQGILPEMGQTEIYSSVPAIWPCVFIDFNSVTFTEILNQGQRANGELQLRLVYYVLADDGVTFLDTTTVMGYYEVERKLHEALQGWSSDGINPLSRIKVNTEVRSDAFRARVLTYSLDFEEYLPVSTVPGSKPQLAINVL
ncbi:MAG: hypothetical protein H6Q26_396 [Bacteroidetes bacterium]|uniref:hypothetical protein n=1 Tax=unclassified Chitinophaga TaxID=2619133 RepID=UPI00117F0BC0|nr:MULTISPECIES: hypothetical protein [unclassified Chitinophaga]MBP1650239.1 hypothetical protein [Bacteroidota bacterium]WPV66593.1 hypothetical protein QQL36_32890 [Chitinophaga sp. LS1]